MVTEPAPGRQPYDPPAVVYEAALEVRAGSPMGHPDAFTNGLLPDPAGLFGS